MRKSGTLVIGLMALASYPARDVAADTLFLRTGKTLKIEALSCHAASCVARVSGGDVEVRAFDVLRVQPDEEVDPQPVAAAEPAQSAFLREPVTIEQMVTHAAHKYALPRSLVRAVARAESGLNRAAVSSKGAQGVMQLMPKTAVELGVQNAFDPGENIDGGARFLRLLLEKYQGHVAEALAAYNAGAGAVAKHKGIPPYRETRGYIRKVVKDFEDGDEPDAAPFAEKKK